MIYKNGLKLGILGGGQLGRMLIQAAIDFDINIHVLDPDPNAPCKDICNSFTTGSFTDFDTVFEFGKNLDVLTIEIEHVNADALSALERQGVRVHPSAEVVRTVQDKGLQKEFYKKYLIPTSDFILMDGKDDLQQHQEFLPAFQKLRTLGYDGRGVQKISSEEDFNKGFDAPSVLEKLVDVEKELSVIVARTSIGDMLAFPVVELEFHPSANLVEFLLAPATIAQKMANKARKLAMSVTEKLGVVGLLAVEMFLTNDGELLVNEVAPRPHNSGHHTIKANATSQYEQHLRAILDLPLGDCKTLSQAVLVNILGEPGYEGEVHYDGVEQVMKKKGVFVHFYGKKSTKPFRKMGHVTILGADLEDAKEKAKFVRSTLKAVTV